MLRIKTEHLMVKEVSNEALEPRFAEALKN